VNQTFDHLINIAEKHIRDILNIIFKHSQQSTIIVADADCPLAIILTEAYRRCLPEATFITFDESKSLQILELFKTQAAGDLVILIQSTSFRLKDFRIRVELFEQALKVIEHPHLARMTALEAEYYIDALAYDETYYRELGHFLKTTIDNGQYAKVVSGNETLVFASPLEPAKLNIGDYSNMKNIGGQFPIGEVFTEAKDLEAVNGRARIFAFGDTTFSVNKVDNPITLIIEKGRVINTMNSIAEFELVLSNIQADEGEIWLRELGFGINRAFTKNRIVSDIGTYERMCGVHVSLGAKHTVFKKPNFKRKTTWHHVDVFIDTDTVAVDDKIIYRENSWVF
jgi:aminopeptidase